jgi:undecaprenyl phosphate-alpha-L-ara4FN deformylase
MHVGLRVDVDTFRGTRDGVPRLCKLLKNHSIRASFFFSVGPDNMGRHILRLLRPAFFAKMVRGRAARLYGWDILLRGTFCPGPIIGRKLPDVIRAARDDGHEIGLHAWDHHAWQSKINRMTSEEIRRELSLGFDLLNDIGCPPSCSAAPGWLCSDRVLLEKERFPFRYNSDCRGSSIFRPVVGGIELTQPQIPVTLPTYDEVIGRDGVFDANYNDYMFSRIQPDALNVLAIHAEAEGIACLGLFEDFLEKASASGISLVPLGDMLPPLETIPAGRIVSRAIPGREGDVACQVE